MAVITESGQINKHSPLLPMNLRLKKTNFRGSGEPGGARDGTNLLPFLWPRSGLPSPITNHPLTGEVIKTLAVSSSAPSSFGLLCLVSISV